MKVKDLIADMSEMDLEAELVIWSGSTTEALGEEPRTYQSSITFRPVVVRKDGSFLEEVDTTLEDYGDEPPLPGRVEVLQVIGVF